ncbi:benzaldehyde dehydrogenase (NAD) [Kitasatospora sp. MAP12-15]|uniref:aldehyde dehydrogenase family protein n=1 Tax=unclassified Kitasatospora TaxID=2633591 RepID=UPI0024730D0A|nr:aldehyde dehydrogenase family protein [Kitasatospora sp. MAP12-44]MDH6111052.1 benzaldehyde dehydrogenase (NAD) [Kitasatospora sp. MAP12-44]
MSASTTDHATPSAQAPAQLLISRDAATGEALGTVELSTTGVVLGATRRAVAAQADWAARPARERARVLLRAADLLIERAPQAIELLVRESGSITAKAFFEVHAAAGELRHAAGLAGQLDESASEVAGPDPSRVATIRRVPLGVAGVIVPWNFPLLLGMRSVAPALALGNAVVLKPDPHTPLSGGRLFAEVLAEAGLPANVLQVVHGDAEAGRALVEAPDVAVVSFTGSTEVGREVGAACGRLLKRVILELGGQNAFIVAADADVELAASAGSWGAFLHQGQICMAARRHLVHEDLVEAYTEALARHAAALRIGDPNGSDAQIGPLIDAHQVRRVADAVERAVAQGARLVTGGRPDGAFFPPTVLADVSPRADVFHTEVFGPVALVTPYRDEDEAVALANDSDYGLTAAVYCADPERGAAIAARLRCGTVHVGDQTVNHDPALPFGGVGASGNGGGFGGPAGVEAFTRWHTRTVSTPSRGYPF